MSIFGEVVPGEGPAPTGFNWGAFLFPQVFLLAYGRVGAFVMLLAAAFLLHSLGTLGTVITVVGGLIVGVKCGSNANQIAWDTGRFGTYEELERSRRRWNIGALVAVGIMIALIIFVN